MVLTDNRDVEVLLQEVSLHSDLMQTACNEINQAESRLNVPTAGNAMQQQHKTYNTA